MDGQFRARLRPIYLGAFTQLELTGVVPTAIPEAKVARLIRQLHIWSGCPVRCALYAEKEAVGWCEWWTDVLAGISERDLVLRVGSETVGNGN